MCKAITVQEFVEMTPDANCQRAIYKTDREILRHKKIAVSISGGRDSDLMLDLFVKLDVDKKAVYLWMNTGLETEATKRHIKYLEQKYNIKIIEIPAKKPIPTCCKQYGVPFLSKMVSEMISRLQRYDFKWEDEPLEVLLKKYPRCRRALRWWCNDFPKNKKGQESQFNIDYNRGLKAFMIANPPNFKISPECCRWAKKLAVIEYIAANGFDLSCTGVRKAEGGARATAYTECYTAGGVGECDQYRPIFWINNEGRKIYEEAHNIINSDCYRVWGLPRTGCSCCPFGKNFEKELECTKKYEPQLYKAAVAIFGKSYDYTRKYREFQKQMKAA